MHNQSSVSDSDGEVFFFLFFKKSPSRPQPGIVRCSELKREIHPQKKHKTYTLFIRERERERERKRSKNDASSSGSCHK
jgi:hypothetical protein